MSRKPIFWHTICLALLLVPISASVGRDDRLLHPGDLASVFDLLSDLLALLSYIRSALYQLLRRIQGIGKDQYKEIRRQNASII